MSLGLTARSLADSTTTKVIVGSEKTEFSIHAALLCEYSDYFQAAYHSELQEAAQHRFVFDDIDSKLFRVLVQWMYTHQIYTDEYAQIPLPLEFWEGEDENEVQNETQAESEHGEDSEPEEEYDEANGEQHTDPHDGMDNETSHASMTPEQLALYRVFGHRYEDSSELDDYQLGVLLKLVGEDPAYEILRSMWKEILHEKRTIHLEILTLLFDLFILADRFGIKALRVRVMDHLQAERSYRWNGLVDILPFELVKKAFANLPEQSTLCRWLIYAFAQDWKLGTDDADRVAARSILPKEFLLGLLVLQSSEVDGRKLDLCYFHEHDTWDELKACRVKRGKELSVDAMEEDYPMFDEDGESTWF